MFLAVLVFCIALVAGTFSTLSSKILFAMEGVNMDGETIFYKKPLMVTYIMFLAMVVALPIHFGYFLIKGQKPPPVATKVYGILVMPAVTDLLATTLYMIGLLYVSVSIYQLIRCLVIVFTAILKRTVLGVQLPTHSWVGVCINAASVGLVSGSALFDPHVGTNPLLGIALVIGGAILNATQFVLEEKVMGDDDTPPLVVVGLEGFWGTVLMNAIMFPIARRLPGNDTGGCYENFVDNVYMIFHNSNIGWMCLAYLIAITSYNISAIFITFLLESVWRSILENFRPCAVWGTQLFLFYVVTNGGFGEQWTIYSWLELAGMIGLMAGTATYNGNLKWPCLNYESNEYSPIGDDDEGERPMVLGVDRVTSSSLITKSRRESTSPFSMAPRASLTGN